MIELLHDLILYIKNQLYEHDNDALDSSLIHSASPESETVKISPTVDRGRYNVTVVTHVCLTELHAVCRITHLC